MFLFKTVGAVVVFTPMLDWRFLMSRFTALFLPLVMAIVANACGRPKVAQSSQVKQIVAPANLTCQDFPQNKSALVSRYGSQIDGYEEYRQDAMLTMTRLPSEYLDFVFQTARAQMTAQGPGQGGLTSWTFDSQGRLPTTIATGTRAGTWNVVNHEMGHASYGYVARKHPSFEDELTNLYAYAVLQGNESGRMQGYPQNNREEFFAEMFDEFYCSAEARLRFKAELPRTFAFAARYLIAPSEGMGFDPNLDTDHDGVKDTEDRCPSSRPDATTGAFDTPTSRVWNVNRYTEGTANYALAKQYNGCQVGQTVAQ